MQVRPRKWDKKEQENKTKWTKKKRRRNQDNIRKVSKIKKKKGKLDQDEETKALRNKGARTSAAATKCPQWLRPERLCQGRGRHLTAFTRGRHSPASARHTARGIGARLHARTYARLLISVLAFVCSNACFPHHRHSCYLVHIKMYGFRYRFCVCLHLGASL